MKKSVAKPIPHTFVLDELEKLSPYTKPMFGFTGVYIEDKIVFVLRERENFPEDNGVWLATHPEHHESLSTLLPSMRSLVEFGPGPTGWQVLPSDSADFEEEVMKACELVLRKDARIGKIPKSRKKKGQSAPPQRRRRR